MFDLVSCLCYVNLVSSMYILEYNCCTSSEYRSVINNFEKQLLLIVSAVSFSSIESYHQGDK